MYDINGVVPWHIEQYTNNVFFFRCFLPTEYYTTTNCVVTTTCSEIAGRRSRNKMASPDERPSQRCAEYHRRDEVCQKKQIIYLNLEQFPLLHV